MALIPKDIHIHIHFDGKIIVEHIEGNEKAVQAAIDKATKDVKENTAQLEAGKGE